MRLREIIEALDALLEGRARVTVSERQSAGTSTLWSRRAPKSSPVERGQEFTHDSVLQQDPLGMGARKTKQMPPAAQRRIESQGAQYLGFLAAHKIRRSQPVLAACARNDVNTAAAQRDAAIDDFFGIGRTMRRRAPAPSRCWNRPCRT